MSLVSRAKSLARRVLNRIRNPYLAGGLTKVPSAAQAPISDLFIWRRNSDWQTHFELLDINHLVNADESAAGHASATFVFFNKDGQEIVRRQIECHPNGRNTIALNDLLPADAGDMGTYACFHNSVSTAVAQTGSYLAERGYSGYTWKSMKARGYVHGNLDAIAYNNNQLELLGNSGRQQYEYCLQHILTGPAIYELALVNSTGKKQKLSFECIDHQGRMVQHNSYHLLSRASCVEVIQVPAEQSYRLTVKSHMYMARPVGFRLTGNSMDVFHG